MSIVNKELQLASDFVQYTGSHIFLTGKAGTGKTTFLHTLRKQTPKRMIITAPTGVAAMNAGGVTLHSFFQLPFGPYLPGSDAYQRNNQRQFRFSKEKKKIIQGLDLLVIDEISMVRADLLDAVDAVLRRYRRSTLPFGGVQLLMIGDLHQLSPVAKQQEWQLLKQHYDSVYFFSSKALMETDLLSIELRHIYRQSDEDFIQILNSVRENRMDGRTLEALNARHIPDFTPDDDQGYITLTTHNASAETTNKERLQELKGKTFSFHAAIEGDFPEQIFPTLPRLTLKKGAQVMFVRNDPSPDKIYYNGKIGKVTAIVGKAVFVRCEGEGEEIEVKAVAWENIKYTLNEESKEIEEAIVGKFEQYPLKLAWAITIHKSQGLTFERAIIDAKDSFAHGQVYVALSRCKSLEGLVLSSALTGKVVDTDRAVVLFDELGRRNLPSEGILHEEKRRYQQKILFECFDFTLLSKRLGYLVHLLVRNASVIQVLGGVDMQLAEQQARESIFVVSENFRNQLHGIFQSDLQPQTLPEDDAHTLDRIKRASLWFQDKFAAILTDSIQTLHVETDNKELRKKLLNVLNNCRKEIAVKLAAMQSCEEGFSPSQYLHAVSGAEIDFEPVTVKKQQAPAYTESDIDHPELFEILRKWRTAKAIECDLARFQILYQRVMIQIVVCLPETQKDLLAIPGVGKKTIEKYGKEIVALVVAYRLRHHIEEVSLPKPKSLLGDADPTVAAEGQQGDTRDTTLELYEAGRGIGDIAQERGLAVSTIEGHLGYFVERGRLSIESFLAVELQEKVAEAIATAPDNSLKGIKGLLDTDCTYGQIKMMVAHQKWQLTKEEGTA